MKPIISIVISAAMLLVLSACNENQGNLKLATDVPQTEQQKRSYALGQNMAGGLRSAGVEYESEYLFAGFSDAMLDKQLMTDEEIQTALITMQQEIQQKQMEAQVKLMEEKSVTAKAYLESNATLEGVATTDSGLQYKVITEGSGAKPVAEDTVTVHYEGKLIDGTVFDSSIQRGEPATFPLSGVIAGWTEGLQLMSVGSKWQFTIPPELAYGQRGAGGAIGPNEVLVFDVELLGIEGAASGESNAN